MKLNHKKKSAWFMIALMLSLTIYTPFTVGQLASISAQGSDGIPKIAKERDYITFNAKATIAGDSDITPNQVILGNTMAFNSCTKVHDSYECTLRFPQNGTMQFDPRSMPYTVSLRNDANKLVDEKSSNFYIDNKVPVIKKLAVDQSLANSGIIRISYTINDTACSAPSCANECAGVKKIDFYEVGKTFAQTVLVDTPGCIVSGATDIQASKFIDGEHTIAVKAYDRTNLPSIEEAITFDLDKTAPVIDVGSFKIVDDVDVDLKYFGAKTIPVRARVDIDLDMSSVLGDFSQFGGPVNASPSCSISNASTVCVWNFNMKIEEAGLKKATIWAKDDNDNQAKAEINRDMQKDSQGPIIEGLESSKVFGNTSFATLQKNTFYATFRDDAGMSPSKTFLKADNVVYTAKTCSIQSNLWKCTWDNVTFKSAGSKLISIEDFTTDRVGNEVDQKVTKEVIVDATKPKIKSIIVRGAASAADPLSNITKTGDRILVEVVIEDEYIQTSYADFSKFVKGASNVAATSCDRSDSKTFTCVWTSEPIDIKGFIKNSVNINIVDVAGNSVSVSKELTVYGTSDSTTDFWDYEVICSPEVLDRETFQLANTKAFCHISLYPNSHSGSNDVEPVSITLGTCGGDVSYLSGVRLHNNHIGSFDPYIEFTFKKQPAKISEIIFECPLKIVTRQGKTILVNPETEELYIDFQFFNLPLGELSSSVQEKIDEAVADATGLLSFVGTLKKIVLYAKAGCNFVNIFENLVNVWTVITSLWGKNPATGLVGWQVACRTTDELHQMQTGGGKNTGIMQTLHKFCEYVNCKMAAPATGVEGEKSWFSWVGDWKQGGSDIFRNYAGGDFIKSYTGKDINSYMTPENSIVLSVMTACIPGIIFGIDKYRQIQCMYADCLEMGVGQQGLPVYVCEDQKAYATCKYVMGEIFNIIPFTAIFNYYMKNIKRIISDPFEILGAALGLACQSYCAAPTSDPYWFCIAPKVAGLLGATIQDVTSIIDGSAFQIKDDYCDQLEKRHENSTST